MSVRRSKRRRRRARRRIIRTLLLAAVILTLYLAFPLKTVIVSGCTHHAPEVITGLVLERPVLGNTLLAKLFNMNRKISQYGFVDSIDVEITGADSIRVNVTERTFIGCVYEGDRWWYFTSAGEVLAYATRKLDGELIPPVEGLNLTKEPALGASLPTTNGRAISMLSVLEKMIETDESLCPDKAVFDENSVMTLVYGDLRVLLGSGERLEMRIRKLQEVLPTLAGSYSGVLHLETYDGSQTGLILDRDEA